MQEAIDTIMHWAEAHLLCLSPSKSEAMIFTRQRKYTNLVDNSTQLIVSGKRIKYEPETVRYLGIWLDRKLNWNHHIRIKIGNVRKLLHKIQGATGSLWGLKPFLGKYFWEALGRTVLAFGCIGWIPSLRKQGVKTRLCALQRQGLKLITFFRRGAPNRGLELCFNVSPMEVHLVELAMKAFFRTSGLEPHTREQMRTSVPQHEGHREFIASLIGGLDLHYIDRPLDPIPHVRMWDRQYTVDMDSMDPKNDRFGAPAQTVPGISVFTDGSKDGHETGAGVAFFSAGAPIRRNGNDLTFRFKLQGKNSVFQTEVWAVKRASEMLLENISNDPPLGQIWVRAGCEVTFFSDSQSTLKALESVIVKSRLVQETVTVLNTLAKYFKSVTLKWVKGHSISIGNKSADTAARQGRQDLRLPEADSPELPLAALNMDIDLAATGM